MLYPEPLCARDALLGTELDAALLDDWSTHANWELDRLDCSDRSRHSDADVAAWARRERIAERSRSDPAQRAHQRKVSRQRLEQRKREAAARAEAQHRAWQERRAKHDDQAVLASALRASKLAHKQESGRAYSLVEPHIGEGRAFAIIAAILGDEARVASLGQSPLHNGWHLVFEIECACGKHEAAP